MKTKTVRHIMTNLEAVCTLPVMVLFILNILNSLTFESGFYAST